MYFYSEYESRTESNRAKIKNCLKKKEIEMLEVRISLKEYLVTWKNLEKVLLDKMWEDKEVLVDITTMPREAIWAIFHFLQELQ